MEAAPCRETARLKLKNVGPRLHRRGDCGAYTRTVTRSAGLQLHEHQPRSSDVRCAAPVPDALHAPLHDVRGQAQVQVRRGWLVRGHHAPCGIWRKDGGTMFRSPTSGIVDRVVCGRRECDAHPGGCGSLSLAQTAVSVRSADRTLAAREDLGAQLYPWCGCCLVGPGVRECSGEGQL
jgi:hypothetical protein